MSKSASLWQDVLLERDLSEGFSGGLTAMFEDPVEKSNPGKMKGRKKNRPMRPYQMRDVTKKESIRNESSVAEQTDEPTSSTAKAFNNNKPENKKKLNTPLTCPMLEMGVSRKLRKKREIVDEMNLNELVDEIRFRIWEHKRWMLLDLVKTVGHKVAIETANEVHEIELKGGVALPNGRRRLPGGVFINLLKNRSDVDQAAIKRVIDKHHIKTKKKSKKENKNKPQ